MKNKLLALVRPTYEVNGKTIRKPFNKALIVFILFVAVFLFSLSYIPTRDIRVYWSELDKIFNRMFKPAPGKTWTDYFNYMWSLRHVMFLTLKMCFISTLAGFILAFPISFLCAKNITKSRFITGPFRTFLNLVRSVPMFLYAIFIITFLRIGNLPGIIAMTIFSFGIMCKMLYDIIETIDMGPVEALDSAGAKKVQVISRAVVPQILPVMLGYFIYLFEINVRASVIMGYVGAGGIGMEMRAMVEETYWDRVGAMVIVLMLVVGILQVVTSYARRRLQ